MFASVSLPQFLLLPHIKGDMGYGINFGGTRPSSICFLPWKHGQSKPDTSRLTIGYPQLVIPHPVEEIQ